MERLLQAGQTQKIKHNGQAMFIDSLTVSKIVFSASVLHPKLTNKQYKQCNFGPPITNSLLTMVCNKNG